VTDGKLVWFFFGNGRLFACRFDGTIVWDRDITKDHGPFSIKFGYSSSPLLFKNRLYIPVLHGYGRATRRKKEKPDSYLLCIDGSTGRDLWKHVRKAPAPEESVDAYTTPHPLVTPLGSRILVNGADCVTAHDPETGAELWRSDNYNTTRHKWFRTITSVTTHGDLIICPVPKVTSMFALRAGGKGQLTREDRVWTFTEDAPDVCVPLSYNQHLFVLDGARGVMTCRDPKTGQALGRRKLQARPPFYASPTGADGKIFCINNRGQVLVLSADKELKVLHRGDMKDTTYGGSIAVANGCLFVRTDNRLFCIKKGAQ
jgi:outer membrane protein assembly factor BamB